MQTFARIDALIGQAYRVIGNLVGISIGAFAVVITVDLGLRTLAIGNLPGMQEIVEYALYAGVFLAAPWVLRLAAHVRVDLVLAALPRTVLVRVERVIDLLGLATCCVLAWYGMRNLMNAYASGAEQREYFNVPEWWMLTVLVLSFVLLALEFVFRIIRAGSAPEAAESAEGGF